MAVRGGRRQRGAVFVVTLFILAAVVAVVVSVSASQQVAIRAQLNRMEQRKARIAAEAGIQRAFAEISLLASNTQGTLTGGAATTQSAVTLQDDWAALGTNGDENFILGPASFRLQIQDASSRLNFNTITEAHLGQLPLTQEQIDSLLDWREAGTTTRAQGAKDEYYNGLVNPYNAKLRRLDSLDELLDIRGYTGVELYETGQTTLGGTNLTNFEDGRTPTLAEIGTVDSFAPELRPDGQAKVNVNNAALTVPQLTNLLTQAGIAQNDATSIATRRPAGGYATLGDVIAVVSQPSYRAVLDGVALSGSPRIEGKINLNTVTQPVLETIPNFPTDAAAAIIQRQSTGFTALSDILSINGLNQPNALRDFAGFFTTQSNTFLVRVVGQSGSSRVALQAVIDIQNGVARILRTEDQPFADMPARWGWNEQPTTETVLVEAR